MITTQSSSTIQSLPGVTQVEIRGKKNGRELLLLGGWLLFWLMCEGMVFALLLIELGRFQQDGRLSLMPLPVTLFLMMGLVFWASRGVPAWRAFLWQLGGRETMEISRGLLKTRHTLFGIGPAREYRSGQVQDVEVIEPKKHALDFFKLRGKPVEVPVTGRIRLHTEGQKPRYAGYGLETSPANQVSALIQRQLLGDLPDQRKK